MAEIDVYRQGRSGNLLEEDGPVLLVDFGEAVIRKLFRGLVSTYRYQETKSGRLYGFASEDKLHIVPATDEEVAAGLRRDIGVETDPGCDIYLELSQNAGANVSFDGRVRMRHYPVRDISRNPDRLLERGIDTLILPALPFIEQERANRANWGVSNVDDEWTRAKRGQ